MSISEMNLKTIKIYKKNNGRLAVQSSQPRGEICGHGAPIQKRKKKVAPKKKENTLKTHSENISSVI